MFYILQRSFYWARTCRFYHNSPPYTSQFFYIVWFLHHKATQFYSSFLSYSFNFLTEKIKEWVTTIISSSLRLGYLLLKVCILFKPYKIRMQKNLIFLKKKNCRVPTKRCIPSTRVPSSRLSSAGGLSSSVRSAAAFSPARNWFSWRMVCLSSLSYIRP